MATAIVCGIILIACFIGIKSAVGRVAHGCCGSGTDSVKKVKTTDKDASHYPYLCEIEVEGMTCSNCKKHVENAFNEKEGFWAKVNLEKKIATIHMKEDVPEYEIRSIISKAGYMAGKCITIGAKDK